MLELLPSVKTFVCILSLKAGTLIIGCVELATSTIILAIRIIYLLQLFKVIDIGGEEEEGGTTEENKWFEVSQSAFIIPTCVILIIATILLLIGTCRGEMSKLRLWIIISLVLFVFSVVSFLITAGAEFYKKDEPIPVRTFHVFKALFFGIIYFLIEFYCIIVVNSFYQENL